MIATSWPPERGIPVGRQNLPEKYLCPQRGRPGDVQLGELYRGRTPTGKFLQRTGTPVDEDISLADFGALSVS